MEIYFSQNHKEFWHERACAHYQLNGECFSAHAPIPMVDFDKVYYIFDENKRQIVACKVKALVFARGNYGSHVYYQLQTPTEVRFAVEYQRKLYATAEDALQSTIGKGTPVEFPKTSFKVLFPAYCTYLTGFGEGFAPTDDRTFVFRSSVTPIRAKMTYLTIDKYGCHVCVEGAIDNGKKKVYLSKEDCIKAEVEGIQIVEFADEPAPAPAPAPESAPAKPKIHTLHFVEL